MTPRPGYDDFLSATVYSSASEVVIHSGQMLLPVSLVRPIMSGMMAFAIQASSPVAPTIGSPHPVSESPRPAIVTHPRISAQEDKRTDEEIRPIPNEPRIVIATPLPTHEHADWTVPERIRWVTELGLLFLGYAGVMLAISALRKIEQQNKSVEALASSANDTAQAALLHAQAMLRSERPWIMVTVEPSPGLENSSTVVATNRGKSPASMVASMERIVLATDEQHLPSVPEYSAPGDPERLPRVLLPGESTAILTFSQNNVEQICSDEELKRVRDWDLKVFVHGRVTYKDFVSPAGHATHETSWCCWYISGERKSGLITMDVPAYTVKT